MTFVERKDLCFADLGICIYHQVDCILFLDLEAVWMEIHLCSCRRPEPEVGSLFRAK